MNLAPLGRTPDDGPRVCRMLMVIGRRFSFGVFGAACLGALAHPQSASADPLRLEDAVRLALTQNERAQKAPLRVDAAEGQLDRARDAFFPTLVAAGGSTLRPTDERNTRALSSNGTVTLTQPLLNPSAFPLYAQASHSLESEKWGATQDKRQLAFETARAFMDALSSDRILGAARRKLETSKANLASAEARAQAGLASTNDVTKAQLDLQNSAQLVTSAQGNVLRTFLNLGFLVGQKVEPPLVAPDQVTRAAEAYEQSKANQVKSALERRADTLKRALDRRPDVRSSHERTEALNSSAREPLYRLAPSLNASGQVRAVPDPLASEKALDESLSVNLVWNVFDAGFRYADRKTRLAQAESQALDEKLLRRSVETDVQLALSALRTARENLKNADGAVEAAQRNSDETELLYRQGLARALEVTDANQKRFDAEVNREGARVTMEQAYLDLRNALGFGPLDVAEAGAQ